MRFDVRHLTRYTYSSPITETQMELRLRPLDAAGQRLLSFELELLPESPLRSYVDAFGNAVHVFNHLPSHELVEITSHLRVKTGTDGAPPGEDETPEDFVHFRPPIVDVPALRRLAGRFEPPDPGSAASVERAVEELTLGISRHVRYLPDSTTVSSSVDDVLRQGSGVCQDFAHLLIAAARTWGVPARYVSGYVYTGSGEPLVGASHAWAEVWVPGRGWQGYDATHPVRTGERHVRVAVGRDYRDAAPTRGVYVGAARGRMEVSVEVRPI
jgi:transglutaminase-like putative cysteine protease